MAGADSCAFLPSGHAYCTVRVMACEWVIAGEPPLVAATVTV